MTSSSADLSRAHGEGLALFAGERPSHGARSVQRVALDDYLASPVGRWVSGESWLHFCVREPWLVGTVLWGNVDAAAGTDILRCATATRFAIPEPHAVLIDGRRTRWLDPGIFSMIAEYIYDHDHALQDRVTRLSLVRPEGLLGAAAEGFFRIVPAPYAATLWTNTDQGLASLGCEDHRETIEWIGRLAATAPRASLLGELHEAVESDLAGITIDAAAKKLGLSSRSLQRRLQVEATTFHREVSLLRMRAAQRKMLETDRPLSCIAQEAGFASHAVFSTAFRRLVGVSPKQWRSMESSARRSGVERSL